jgi:Alginate export
VRQAAITGGATVVLALCLAARAGAQELPSWRDRITFSVSDRVRGEFVDWFGPPSRTPEGDPIPADAERYNFFANRFRAGVRVFFPPIELNLQFQYTELANVPEDASLPPPVGNLGTGAIYFANTHESPQGEPVLKQATVTMRGRGVTATLGRFEYRDGLEVVPADATLAVLAKTRIAERLVGPFDFTNVGRTFDGARVAYDTPDWNLTAMGSRPTQGGFEVSANRELDIELAGLAWTLKRLPNAPPLSARLFYLYYRDGRDDALKVDNRSLRARTADTDPISINTIGADAITVIDAGPGIADLLVWGLVQTGTWGRETHGAWAWAMEAGYQLPQVPTAPWLRAGWDRSSGDSNPSDGHHRTFFQLIPTARTYARLPFFNLMNSSDVFLELQLRPHERALIRSDLHWLRLTEGRDLWYSGGGATSNTFFGYAGSPAFGSRALARLADISVTVQLHQRLTLEGYYGHAFGRSVVGWTFPGKDANYGFLELTFTY